MVSDVVTDVSALKAEPEREILVVGSGEIARLPTAAELVAIPGRTPRKRVAWFLDGRSEVTFAWSRCFSEVLLLDLFGVEAVLTHQADRDVVRRSFAALGSDR